MNKTATFIKEFPFNGSALWKLYKCDPPLEGYEWEDTQVGAEYVIVSAAMVPYTGPETYIFQANEDGEVIDWGELPGSYRGGLSHAQALQNVGYTVV